MVRCCVMKKLLIVVSVLSVSAALTCSDLSAPVWANVYTASGRIVIPKAGVEEPFTAYYNGSDLSSRIDYWDGHVKTLQNGATPPGKLLRIVPASSDTQRGVASCFRQKGTVRNPIEPQTVLPNVKSYKCAGIEVIDGVQNQKWISYEKRYLRNIKYTMVVKVVPSGEETQIVPLKFEVKVQDTLLGTVSDHYIIYYDSFTPTLEQTPSWNSENDTTVCVLYPNSTAKSLNYFNPMAEFVSMVEEHIMDEWEEFKKKYKKLYTGLEDHKRQLNFRQHFRFVMSVNRAGLTYKTRINQFADWNDEEFQLLRSKISVDNGGAVFPTEEMMGKEIPPSMDWRLYGAVTPVKDQGLCGAGWAYAATGVLEGVNFQRTGLLVTLSEGALLDCSWAYGNAGCDGGDVAGAYKWVVSHGGLPLSEDYRSNHTPEGICRADQMASQSPISGYVLVTPNNSSALEATVSTVGPVSIAIHASLKSFIFYSHGIYSDKSCKPTIEDLDHYALLVGYGELSGKKYWLVKNSWSAFWGNDGYVLISLDDTICGVMTSPTYVTT